MNHEKSILMLVYSWPDFMEPIRRCLEKEEGENGDSFLTRLPSELAKETEEELLDVTGWAFFLWIKIWEIKNGIDGVEAKRDILSEFDY